MNKTKKSMLYPENPKGIYLYEYPVINGIRQYVQVRGTNKSNPLLLFIHGGPGGSLAGLTHILQKGWEDRYTVVNWDQRNTCKTYYANKNKAEEISKTGTIDEYISDIDEVIAYLHTVYDFDKLILMGFSWGSVIGSEYAKRHPENLKCYIGVGQLVDFREGINFICSKMNKMALEKHNLKDIAKIQNITNSIPDKPEMTKEFMGQIRTFSFMASGYIAPDARRFPVKEIFSSPFMNLTEKFSMMKSDFSLFDKTIKTMMTYDFSINMKYEIPVLFVYGEEDFSSPLELFEAYYDKISAPEKKLVIIPKASHNCFYDKPHEFLQIFSEFIVDTKLDKYFRV